MTQEELKEYHEIVTESWKMFRAHATEMPLSDDQWTEIVHSTHEIAERHSGRSRFARKVIMAVVDELEHLDREEKGVC